MPRNAPVLVGTAIGAVLGAALTYVLLMGQTPTLNSDQARQHTSNNNGDLEEIARRLSAIEALLPKSTAMPASMTSDSPQAVREESVDIRSLIEEHFTAMRGQIAAATAGLGEISKSKPAPDVAAIAAFRKAEGEDSAKAHLRIKGMTYRDAVLEFGSPTLKFDHSNKVHGPGGGRVSSWLWETPELGYEFAITFEVGTATHGWTSPTGRAKQYITTLGEG